MKSTISAKGQITVPVEYRNKLGLKKGTVLLFELRDDGLLLRKGSRGVHPVDLVFGSLDATDKRDSLALLDEMRGPRPGGRRARRR